jgi:hypothetical protein
LLQRPKNVKIDLYGEGKMNVNAIVESIKNYLPLAEVYPVLDVETKVLFRYAGTQYVADGHTVTECLDDPDFPDVDIDLDFEEALDLIATVGY